MSLQLYCFGESGNAYKVALMLAVGGADWTPVWVDFFHGGHRRPEYLALNEMGEVPLLVEGELKLSQSGAILTYLAGKLGRFGGQTESERLEILRWLLWDNHKFTANIAIHRFLINFLPPAQRQPDVIAFHAARQKSAMKVLERHLAGRDWVVGAGPTIADFSLCGYLYYPEPFGFERADWPALDAWLNRIAALPGWRHPYDLMPRGPQPGAPT
jgi:glutathione S-transferase